MLWLEPVFKNWIGQRKEIVAQIQESELEEPLTFHPNDSAASHCCFLEPAFAFVTIFILQGYHYYHPPALFLLWIIGTIIVEANT